MDNLPVEGEEQNNIDVIQRYSESVYKTVNDSINALNTKLATVIGFSGVLLRFANDLEGSNQWLAVTKISVCLLLIASVVCSVIGLWPGNTGGIVPPRELRKDYYYEEEEVCKRYITDNLIAAIEQMDAFTDKQRGWLIAAIAFLAIGTIIFGLDIAVNSGLKIWNAGC